MPIGLVGAALIGSAASAGASLYGAHKQASTARDVARMQGDAATRASGLLQDASRQSAGEIGAERDRAMGTFQPYTQLGTTAASSLLRPEFTNTPQGLTAEELQADPSYQFRLQQGQKALERSAAARGTLLTGGTARSLLNYGQNAASQEYGNVYNRKQQGINDTFSRLSSLLNFGQNAQGQENQLGFNYANLLSNNRMLGAGAGAQGITDVANANAAGRIAGSNAYGGALSGVGNNLQDLLMLYALQHRGNNTPSGMRLAGLT